MKTLRTLTIATVAAATIAISGTAFAGSWSDVRAEGYSYDRDAQMYSKILTNEEVHAENSMKKTIGLNVATTATDPDGTYDKSSGTYYKFVVRPYNMDTDQHHSSLNHWSSVPKVGFVIDREAGMYFSLIGEAQNFNDPQLASSVR